MTLRNKDLDLDKFFVHATTNDRATLAQLRQQPLSREVYFSPSNSPLTSVDNVALGSCFQNWIIPSASVFLDKHTQHLPQYLTFEQYQNLLTKKLQDTVQNIYKQHSHVYLSYSGGIDSMAILSMVLSLKLIARTTLVVFENQTQSHVDCLHNDDQRKHLVHEVCQQVASMGATVEKEIIGVDDFCTALNHSIASTKCYVTHTLLTRHADRAWMFGHHGNQLYLHKDVFLDEILYRDSTRESEVKSAVAEENYYTKNLKNYKFNRPLVPLHQRHLVLKPWHQLDNLNGCKVYSPIGPDNETFDWCRSVDFSSVPAHAITHATVPRHIIESNNQSWLTDYLTTESVTDMDCLGSLYLPIDQIDSDLLSVPDNLNHHADGVEWLEYEIEQAKTSKIIPINTAVSLKNLHWLACK